MVALLIYLGDGSIVVGLLWKSFSCELPINVDVGRGGGVAVKRGDPGRRDGPRLQIRQSNVCRGGREGEEEG